MKRGRKPKFIRVNKDRLIDLYINKKLRMVEIEALLDMTYPTVLKALDYHDIPVRPKDLIWDEPSCKRHGVNLRGIHAEAKQKRLLNESIKTNSRNGREKQKERPVLAR